MDEYVESSHAYYHNEPIMIEIPNTDRIPIPPSTIFQHRYFHLKMPGYQTTKMVDLVGRSPDEVQRET